MFNGYNETPLISSYNDFDQEKEKKQENGGKWSYGPDQFAQHHSNNRQSEFWSPKPNLIGIPNVVNIPAKCNCSSCYSSPENQCYQGDSTRHRPWLPRTFPIPLNGSNESCKIPGYHQWDNVGLSSQGPCFSEGNPLSSQYLQENGGKHSYYRSYQNSRLSEPNQPGVITSVKNSDFVKKDVLLKQKDEMSTNSATHGMVFFGQNGTKQPMFCNPTYSMARNMDKRIDNRSCSANYCDPSEKYSTMDSCRHSTTVASYGLEQHVSRLPVVEPYMKTVPSNVNQNRVPSTGHRSLKENKSQSYIDQSYGDSRKICSEGNQTVNGNKNGRPVYPSAAVKDGTACENFQSGQLHNIPPPMSMDLKSGGVHIDYSHFNANRDFSRSCANISESETQKFMFENNRHPDYFSRSSMSDVIKRNNQVPLLDVKKDCAIAQIGQMNMPEQHCSSLPRSNTISNIPKYLEVGNSKSSCGIYYAKDYNGDKISKSDKFDQMPENPVTFQRSEDGLKNDNLNVHARIPRSALVFNDPRDSCFADRAQNSYPYQNSAIAYKNYVRSEYSYPGYNTQGRYEYPHVTHSLSGLQRNDLNQYNHRAIPQQQPPNCGSDQFLPHANNSYVFDPHCQQPGNSDKSLPQQFCDNKNHSPASSIQVASSVFDHNSVDVRLDLPLEGRKPNNIETIRAEDINKNGNSKISPLRLLRKKKFVHQKSETVLESISSSNTANDTAPALDVRKFWSTWAEEEDENISTQMVVLDCQNIDPEQAKFLQLYDSDPARTMRLENGEVITLKGSSCDKDPSNQPTHFSAESQEVNMGYDQVSLLNEPRIVSPIINKENCENKVEATQQEDTANVKKSLERNSEVETVDAPHEKMDSSKVGETERLNERPVESVDRKTEIMSPKNDSKPCKRGRSRASQENKEGHRSKKVNLEKKTEKVNRLDKWTEKKFDFLKRAEESKAAEILRHEEEKKRIFERRLSFQQGNATNEVKKISSNSKTPVAKEKLEMVNKEAKSLTHPEFENEVVNEIFKSLSPLDDNSLSNSSEDSKGDLPHLPTSEYRRNKFLDYSEKKLFGNTSFSSSLENVKALDLGSNSEVVVNEDTNAKSDENYVPSKGPHSLPVSEIEEIKKEILIKQECLTKNNWPSSEKYLTEKLGNNIFHSSLNESLIDNIKLKGESGLHSFVMEDILKKMSEINFRNSEVKSESIDKDGILNSLKSEAVVEKTNKLNRRIKKTKKLEHQEENDERRDKLTVENISVSKPTIKFSIQKSHDLKISFKVLNSSKKYEKCESDEDGGRKEVEGKNDSVDESKNSTELITLKLKSVQRDGSNCDRSHKLSKKIPFSRNGTVLKKSKRRFRRKKIRGNALSPLKTPVLKIKKSRYLLQDEERDPLAEDTVYDKCSNLSRKPCSDEYSTSDDFQVQETIDSAKIKLTFKRHRADFETEYKVENNDDEEDDNNNVEDSLGDLEPEDKFKVVEFDDECASVTKTRFKKKSKRDKHRGIFNEGSVISFKGEEKNAKETLEPNVDSDFETISNEGELKSVPKEESVNSASLEDLFGEDKNYNFNEEEEEEEPESTSRIFPRVLPDVPLAAPSFQIRGNDEEGKGQTSSFPGVNSNCFLEGDLVKGNSVENVSIGSESLIENDDSDFFVKSKYEGKVNPIRGNHTNDNNHEKEVSLSKVNTKSDEGREDEERNSKNSCLSGTTESPEDDETLQEYPSSIVRIKDAVKKLSSTLGDSEKGTSFEGVDVQINNKDTSLRSIQPYSHENENEQINFEPDNESNTLISRDASFECEDLDNDIEGMNYEEEIPETSDDNNNNNNNNNNDNAKQLICSGQNFEDEKSSEVESSDSSTNQVNHSKNKSSYESKVDENRPVEKTYSADFSLNNYCSDDKIGERSNEKVVDNVQDSEYTEAFSGKVDDWKNYSNSLISDVDDLNDNLSNPYELEGNRLFDQEDGLLTTDKNFKEGDTEMDSRSLLHGDKFSAEENSTSLGLLDTSESQNDSEFGEGSTKGEKSKPGDELVFDKADQDSTEKIENEMNISSEENNQQEETRSPLGVESSVENDSQFVEKVDESCVLESDECLKEEKEIVDQGDGAATTETPDFYSSSLSPKSVPNQSGDNSTRGDDDASDLKQINIGGSNSDVKEISEVSDSSKEENRFLEANTSTDRNLSLVETIFSDTGCERDPMGENSALNGAYEGSVVDFISEFSDNQRSSSDALDESENFSNEVPECHSKNSDLEEGEIVEEDSPECSKEMLSEDMFVGMTREAKPFEAETDFGLRNSGGFCANNIDSPREKTETTVDETKQNGEESNRKHEGVNTSFDVKVGNDCKIKNSCRYFLEEIKFDKSRIRRRHSLKVDGTFSEVLGKLKSSKSERSTESQKFKFNKSISSQKKRSNSYYFKARSCPPSIMFFNKNDYQVQIAVLDIPVEDIPLPSGDPPLENCFNFEEYFKRCKNVNEPKVSESNLDLELHKLIDENRLEKDKMNPLISVNSPMDDAESANEELNVTSKQLLPLKDSMSHLGSSSANCKSPFLSSDLENCRNPSPPLFKEKHLLPSTSNPMESLKNDLKPEELDESSETVELSSKKVKMEGSIAVKSEEIDWSPLKLDEGWQADGLDEGNMDSSVVPRSSVKLTPTPDSTQLSLDKSIPCTQGIYDDITKSSNKVDINFENENVKIQSFSIFSEEEMTPENNNRNSNEINCTKEKDLKEQSEVEEINDSRPEENEKRNENEVVEDKNCIFCEIKEEVSVKTSNAENDEIQNDYENSSPLKLICEDVDMEEMELRDLGSKTVDIIDDDSLNVLGFENDDYIRNDFYECEGIPTSEDLPNGDQNEDDKVSDDDKFRNIMQNCLDNAKKFLNEGNLKLFSGSVDDLLELDCQMISENEADKSTSDSVNHISRDVLLTSCEDTVTDDLGLSQKFQPEDLSMDFVPSFCSDGSNNLCSEILPVDNWPYLEEEVPLSPTKPKQDETDLFPFLDNFADKDNIPEYNDDINSLEKSQDDVPPVVNNRLFRTTKKTISVEKGNTDKFNRFKVRRMSYPNLENRSFKRFRRKSLLTESQTFKTRSSITAQRRKTIDGSTKDVLRDSSVKAILDGSGVDSELETSNTWQDGNSLKCRLSLEKLRKAEPCQDKYKSMFNTSQEAESEKNIFKEIKTVSKDVKSLKSEESSKKSEPTPTISVKKKNFPKYKTSLWQPRVMLYRISQKELKNIRDKSNMKTQSTEDRMSSKRNSYVEFLQERATSEDDFESCDVNESDPRPAFKKQRSNYLFESGEFEQDIDSKGLSEKSKSYVKSNSKNRLKSTDGKVEGHKNNSYRRSLAGAVDSHAYGFHKSEKATKPKEKENHHGSEESYKAQEVKPGGEKLDSPMSNYIKIKKHKKSRFRNLHSSKRSKPHLNVNPLAKDISSPAQNILPLDDPTLVDTERVLSEIFRDCDSPQEEILNSPKKSTKGLLPNNKSEDDVNVKKKLTVWKDETTQNDKKAKNSSSVDSPRNTEEHNARINSKIMHGKHNHSSSVSEKTVKTRRDSDKGHFQVSNKHSRESSKRRRSESIHSYKDEKKEISEKGCSKHEERKEEKCESRERHSRHEKKREKHSGAKDRRKETSKHKRQQSDAALLSLKSQNKDKHTEAKNSKGVMQKNEESRSKGSPEPEKCRPMEPDLDSPWICEVCGFDDAFERVAHIKTHPFHCQSCHLAFKTESYFISHLTKKHKDIRNQHHCLLCELSFDTEEQYHNHLETREHRHLESVEKNTINTLFTLLTGQPCPVLGVVEMKPEWLPNQAGTVHFYHQATPLSLALQYLKMHHDLSSSSTVASAHLN